MERFPGLSQRLRRHAGRLFAFNCADLMCPHFDRQFPKRWRRTANDDVARFYRANTLGRSGVEQIAWIERVKFRCEFHKAAATVDKLAGFAFLALFAVNGETDRDRVWIGNLICGYEPRAEDGVAVDRFAKAP